MKLDKSLQLQVAERLRLHVEQKYQTQAAAAREWGVTPAFVSVVLAGKKSPTPAILEDAGIVLLATPGATVANEPTTQAELVQTMTLEEAAGMFAAICRLRSQERMADLRRLLAQHMIKLIEAGRAD